jgi:uroporphyrinogen decarboxylase
VAVGKRERLEAAIAGQVADRPPIALWRHFPVDDQDPQELARSVVGFQRSYDFDFVKVSPASSFCLKDWGADDRWEGATEGTRNYTTRVVQHAGDWEALAPLPPDRGHLGRQLECIQAVIGELGSEVPVIQTVFSPLSQAKNLAGKGRLLADLNREPKRVAAGLATILETTLSFIERAAGLGIAGIFYAIQHASYQMMDRQTYRELAEAGDRAILEAAGGLWLNVVHLHGQDLMFDVAEDLPAQVVNWHDRTSGPDLASAAGRVRGAVCGGLRRHQTLVLADPAEVRAEALDALASVNGRGIVLGAGCVTPINAPASNIRAARAAVEDFA